MLVVPAAAPVQRVPTMKSKISTALAVAWGIFACATSLGVLTVPALAVLVRSLGTFTPELCTPLCDVAISGGLPTPVVDDDYLFVISGGELRFTATVTLGVSLALWSGFPDLNNFGDS